MNNTTHTKQGKARLHSSALVWALSLAGAWIQPSHAQETRQMNLAPASAPTPSETLNARQQAIVPIAAFAAAGEDRKSVV